MTLDQAKEILKDAIDGEGLHVIGGPLGYLWFHQNSSTAVLDGDYTADQLEAIAVFMRACRPVPG